MAWQFILSDLTGNVHGEVTQASARKVTLPHLRTPSATFTIPIWHELAPTLLDTDCLLRAYRTDTVTGTRTLAFHGPVVSAEETTEENAKTVAVTAAGPFWRLSKRLIPSSMDRPLGANYGSEGSLIDLGTIARTILQEVNATHFTGIDLGTHAPSTSAFVSKWFLKVVSEAIAELGAGLDSFEHRVRPTEATSYANPPHNWPRIGLFDVAPILGATKDNAIFEYGTTRSNIATYKRVTSRETMLNQAIISVQGWPDSVEKINIGTPTAPNMQDKYNLLTASDATSINARGLFEEVVSDAGVLDDALRQDIAQFHVDIRKNPKNVITFKPVVNARPAPFVDYEVGDTVRARAYVKGKLRFDAMFRIWGLTFEVDANGNESVELELVMPSAASN